MNLPPKVTIVEVGPRDGFQNEKQFIPTEKKVDIVNALSRAGLKNIQVISILSGTNDDTIKISPPNEGFIIVNHFCAVCFPSFTTLIPSVILCSSIMYSNISSRAFPLQMFRRGAQHKAKPAYPDEV